MSYEKEINSVFSDENNSNYAKKVIDYIDKNLRDVSITVSKVPDIRFKINNRVFFRIKKSCAIDFFLDRNQDYEGIKRTTITSTHTHDITGKKTKYLIDNKFDLLKNYIEQSYHNVR